MDDHHLSTHKKLPNTFLFEKKLGICESNSSDVFMTKCFFTKKLQLFGIFFLVKIWLFLLFFGGKYQKIINVSIVDDLHNSFL
jgi:hypothetical protein